jgi:DNA-binding CsgD family transcriptional regulator
MGTLPQNSIRAVVALTAPPFLRDAQWGRAIRVLHLSPQCARIVARVALAQPYKQIAAELGIRPTTLRSYAERLYRRLGVRSRGELMLRVIAAGTEGALGK